MTNFKGNIIDLCQNREPSMVVRATHMLMKTPSVDTFSD